MTSTAVPTLTTAPSVVRALLEGEIVVDVRAGAGPVPAVGDRLWLTADGPDPELRPAYRLARSISATDGAPAGVLGWAELTGTGRATLDDAVVSSLGGKTVVALEPLAGQEVVVLALRAHRLAEPITGALPADPGAQPSVPALSDVAFQAKEQSVAESLPDGLSR